MKKDKLILVSVSLLALIVLSVCIGFSVLKKEKNQPVAHTPKAINEISYITIDKLPHDLNYNGINMSLTELELYKSPTKYGHSVYATVKISTSQLDDKDLYWLNEDSNNNSSDKVLKADLALSNSDNALEDHRMTRVGTCDFDDFRIYYYINSAEIKNDLSQAELELKINIEQDEIYDVNKKNKVNSYSFSKKFDSTNAVKDIKQMPQEIKTNFVNALDQFNSNLSNYK